MEEESAVTWGVKYLAEKKFPLEGRLYDQRRLYPRIKEVKVDAPIYNQWD